MMPNKHKISGFGLKCAQKMAIFRTMIEPILKSAEIALLGMGTVFILLSVLIVGVTLIARICSRFVPEVEPIALAAQAPVSNAANQHSLKVAAATIAVKKYRQSRES